MRRLTLPVYGMALVCLLSGATGLADTFIEVKMEKFIDVYIDEIRWWPLLWVGVPGASSVHFSIAGKQAETPLTYEVDDDEWGWEPTPPPWTLTLAEMDQYAGDWTVTVNKDDPTEESVYTFTVSTPAASAWASSPELLQPVQDEDLPENYYFRWGFREGPYIPAGTHVSLSVTSLVSDDGIEVNSDGGTMGLYDTAHKFAPGELTVGEAMARLDYTGSASQYITNFAKASGKTINWDAGTPELKTQAGQNLSFWIFPANVNNGGFTPSNPADPTNPPDPNEPFAGWTMFGAPNSVIAVENPFDLPGTYVPQFTAWSPGGLTETVDTPDDPFFVCFDYAWLVIEPGAVFTVYIDGTPVGSIPVPAVPDPDWQAAVMPVGSGLCGLSGVELRLELDGPVGSSLVIDNFEFSNVPEPASMAVLVMGTFLLLARGTNRRR